MASSSSPITPFNHEKAKELIEHPFNDPSLLIQALTHRSVKGTPSYEMLEQTGDIALKLGLLNRLHDNYPGLDEGKVAKLLSANLTNEKLARAAVHKGIHKLIRHNSAKVSAEVENFCDAIINEPEEFQSYGGSQKQAPKTLADVIEAIAGAIYRDTSRNLDKMWQVLQPILEPLVTPENITDQPVDRLYRVCDRVRDHIDFQYGTEGALASADFSIHGELVGHGTAPQKRIAKINAARDALENFKNGKSALLELKPHKFEDEKEAPKKLHKFCESMKLQYPVYKQEKEIGPADQRKFLYSAQVSFKDGSYLAARGAYKPRIKAAKRSAAFNLLFKVNHHPKHT